MKRFSLPVCLCLILFSLSACSDTAPPENAERVPIDEESFVASPQEVEMVDVETLPIGASAPDFRLPGVDGRYHQLSDYSDSDVLVVVFTCNHCPTAQAYEERIKEIVTDYRDKSFALVAISPNSPLALLDEECGYSDMGDTFEEMKIRARDHEFNFPYLYDGDQHTASIDYGPTATPHAFVFDSQRKLQYVGRIDGSEKPGSGNGEDLRAAIDSVFEGQPVANPVTKTFGCSIKWGWKLEWKAQVNREWREAPVEVEEIDVAGVEELLANDSDKLRLVNVWATWCGPCVIEYPELIKIHRMYKDRGTFEFVSLSADTMENRDEVLKFLEAKESAVKNYIFNGEDQYALIEAVDPEWSGALPYTVLLEPGGKVLHAVKGTMIEPLPLKRAIVEHELIGRYY